MADRASLMYAIQQGGRLKNVADRPVGEVKESVEPKQQPPREWKFKNKTQNEAEIQMGADGVPLPPPPPPPLQSGNNTESNIPPAPMSANSTVAPPPPPIPAQKPTTPSTKNTAGNGTIPPPPPLGVAPPKRAVAPAAAPKKVVKKPFDMKKGNFKSDVWHNIKAVKRSESGSAGVFFVNRDDGTTVLKSSSNCPKEYLASVLALRLGFSVPDMRVINYNHNEWGRVKMDVGTFVKNSGESGDIYKLWKELDRAYFLAMETVVGKPLTGFAPKEYDVLFGVTNRAHEDEVMAARLLLREIGKVVALDLFFNQWDRMPIVWDNEGNFDNILIEQHGSGFRVVAIDNSVTSLHMPIPLEKYLKSVHGCLTSITTEPHKVFKGFINFAEMFLAFTGYKFSYESLVQMQFGVLEGVLSIIQHVSEDMLTAFKKEMHDVVPKHTDWANVWFDGIKEVSVDFLLKMNEEFKLHRDLAEKVLKENPLACAMVYNSAVDTNNLPFKDAKILVMQQAKYSSLSTAEQQLDEIIKNDPSGRLPDFIIYPEFWIAENGVPNHNHAVNRFKHIAKKYNCYIIMGTLVEVLDEVRKMHITAPIISPAGELIGAYRKRKPTGIEMTPGNEIFAMDTKFGRVTVMICFDIENADIFDENMAQKPFLMLNPVFIPSPAMNNDAKSISFGWRNAVDVMRRKFEALAGKHRFTIVRADQPFTDRTQSFGTSQVIGPYASVTSPTANETHFWAFVDLDSSNWFTATEPTIHRTAPEDNTGNRYCIYSLRSPSHIAGAKLLPKNNVVLSVRENGAVSHLLWNGREFKFENTVELAKTSLEYFVSTKDNEVYISDGSTIQKFIVDLHATTFKQDWEADLKGHVADLVCYLDNILIAADHSVYLLNKNGQILHQLELTSDEPVSQVLSLSNSSFAVLQRTNIVLLTLDGTDLKASTSLSTNNAIRRAVCLGSEVLPVQDETGAVQKYQIESTVVSIRGSIACSDNLQIAQGIVEQRLFGFSGREMQLLTLESDKLVVDHCFKNHVRNINTLHFDGSNAATTDDGEVKLWEFTQNNHKVGLTKMLTKTV